MRNCSTCSKFRRIEDQDYGRCTLGGKRPEGVRQFSVTVKASGFCAEHDTSLYSYIEAVINYLTNWGKNGKGTD
jgi:hypothetical protein